MAKSQSESLLVALPLKLREARGVTKGFARGKTTVPGPGRDASPDFLALDGRGLG